MLDFVQKILAKITKRRIRRIRRLETAAAWPGIIGGGGVRRRRAALMCKRRLKVLFCTPNFNVTAEMIAFIYIMITSLHGNREQVILVQLAAKSLL